MSGINLDHRKLCYECMRPSVECYCGVIKPFNVPFKLVILFHPVERRRGVGTGRMASLCVRDALLIEGFDFSDNAIVNRLVNDPKRHGIVLYPRPDAIRIDRLAECSALLRTQLFPPDKEIVLFIVDGTWHHAKKMVRLSQNLHHLPFICFHPDVPSRFRIRQQPEKNCLSTIEALHYVLRLLDADQSGEPRDYDNLLEVFEYMVERQITHSHIGASRHFNHKHTKKVNSQSMNSEVTLLER